jgi:RimJ/RimL family protein N-acetyltransferase
MGVTTRQVETGQLLLRPPVAEDEAGYLELFRKPEVEARLRPPPLAPFTSSELTQMLSDDVDHWQRSGFGPWALLETAGGAFVGRVGLRWTAVAGAAAVELAWTVDPDRQGRGFATEAAAAALELGRSEQIEEVVALVEAGNAASRRVAEKIGMGQEGEVEHAGLPHLVYKLRLRRCG